MSVLWATEYLGGKTNCFSFMSETDLVVRLCRLDDRDTMSMIGGTTFKRPSDSSQSNQCLHVRPPATEDNNCDELRKKTRYRFQLLIVCCCVHLSFTISQLPKLCVKISILMHRRMWVRSFSSRLTSVTFAEDKMLIFLILRKNAKIVQLWV